MALRAGYWGIKKLLSPLKLFKPGELGIDNDALVEGLNPVFFPRSEQAVLGAKQWFNIDAPNTVYNATVTKSMKSLRVQGESKTYSNVNYVFRHLLTNTSYIMSTSVDYTSGLGKVSVEGSTDGSVYTALAFKSGITSDQDVSINFNTGNYAYIRVLFFCSDSAAIDGDITFDDIMIRLASDPDPTWVPYAMTNKELTDASRHIQSVNLGNSSTCKIVPTDFTNQQIFLIAISGSAPLLNGLFLVTVYGNKTAAIVEISPTSGSTVVVNSDGELVITTGTATYRRIMVVSSADFSITDVSANREAAPEDVTPETRSTKKTTKSTASADNK